MTMQKREEIMQSWDKWRAYIAGGGGGSWPRDAFESLLDEFEAYAAERERRIDRQRKVSEWCAAAFGPDHASSVPQRAVRLLEEAVEAYQAAGADPAMAHKLIDFVFSRPAGALAQELGGIGLTLLALAHAAGADADAEEAREFARALAKPLAFFTARNESKNAAGFVIGYETKSRLSSRPATEGKDFT